MDAKECVELRIEVRASPETNDHEVRLLADGKSLVDRFPSGLIGLDPDDLLTDPSPLRAESSSRAVIIGRCSCGIVGCGSVEVEIRRDYDHVIWKGDGLLTASLVLADQNDAEVERALRDHSWETPERTAARLISQAFDRDLLARRGFVFSWASGRCRHGMMTAALVLTPGPFQVLINVPWNGDNIERIVRQLSLILGQPLGEVAEC
jgi:hypothetical protein